MRSHLGSRVQAIAVCSDCCRFALIVLLLFVSNSILADTTVHHRLKIKLVPSEHRISVVDTISYAASTPTKLHFSLNNAFKPIVTDKTINLKQDETQKYSNVKYYSLTLPRNISEFSISYNGVINNALDSNDKEQSRSVQNTSGIISSEGVYLAGSSFWYPDFFDYEHLSFELDVQLPNGWHAVSQGEQLKPSRWKELIPQREIYLLAGKFHQYNRQTGDLTAQVYLTSEDKNLSDKYLDATDKYIKMYESLLGPYPYQKFALVENFWETGFGMPSFTLLGSKVIRFPFILNSSFPHEILHNWWGNGVYVDYPSGNWGEGLTAYLADHLIKEQQGQAVAYRQQSLQKYSDYATTAKDFPLHDFRSRHSSVSEAIGYGKSMMLFHMLRQKIGDETFIAGLQSFYKKYRFNTASFADIQHVFETVSTQSLDIFFEQWVHRTGAPEITVGKYSVTQKGSDFLLSVEILQTQKEAAYQLDIPVAITLEGKKYVFLRRLSMKNKQQAFSLTLPAKPSRLDIDPYFDIFRKLHLQETPAAFTKIFGSRVLLVILPSNANAALKRKYQAFALEMKNVGPDKVSVIWDNTLSSLPKDVPIVLIGWENLFYNTFKFYLKKFDITFSQNQLKLGKEAINTKALSVAITSRRDDANGLPLGFIATDLQEALPGLARKLPHYHKYSHLAFTGPEPNNIDKGRWPVTQSPMSVLLTPFAVRAESPPGSILITRSKNLESTMK